MDPDRSIRRLVPSDAFVHRALRIEAIVTTPYTFAEEVSRAMARTAVEHALALSPTAETSTFGAFDGDVLVGMAALTQKRAPFDHIAKMSSVFLKESHRGSGLAADLVATVERVAGERGIGRLTLAVAVQNDAARRFYDRMGYVPYGVEPCAMRLEGKFVDEELRSKFLVVPDASVRILLPVAAAAR